MASSVSTNVSADHFSANRDTGSRPHQMTGTVNQVTSRHTSPHRLRNTTDAACVGHSTGPHRNWAAALQRSEFWFPCTHPNFFYLFVKLSLSVARMQRPKFLSKTVMALVHSQQSYIILHPLSNDVFTSAATPHTGASVSRIKSHRDHGKGASIIPPSHTGFRPFRTVARRQPARFHRSPSRCPVRFWASKTTYRRFSGTAPAARHLAV